MISSSRRRAALLAVAAALTIVLLLALALTRPVRVEEARGDAHVLFESDRRLLVAQGGCVTIRWAVEGIDAVFIDGMAAVGTYEGEYCPEPGQQPVLLVRFKDGMESTYTLPLGVFFANPLSWLAMLAAAGLLLAAAYLWFAPALSLAQTLRRAAGALLPVGFGLLLTALFLELGLRFYFANFGTERARISYLYSAEEIAARAPTFVGLPYVNFVPAPAHENHNPLGYRGPAFAIPKPEGTFRIVALGGSTTYGYLIGAEDAYPAQLQAILREEYGYTHVEVVNAGVVHYSTWDTLTNFAFRVLEIDPDLVIVYHAINDAAARAVSPDCYRPYNPRRGLHPLRGIWRAGQEALGASVLYRYIAVNLGWMEDPALLEAGFDEIYPCASEPEPTAALVAANPPVFFERNMRNIVAIAQANGVQVILSSWAWFDDGKYWRDAVVEHNAIAESLAEEMDVPFYDLQAELAQDPDFWWDGFHFSPEGAHAQARHYAAFLAESGLLPAGE